MPASKKDNNNNYKFINKKNRYSLGGWIFSYIFVLYDHHKRKIKEKQTIQKTKVDVPHSRIL